MYFIVESNCNIYYWIRFFIFFIIDRFELSSNYISYLKLFWQISYRKDTLLKGVPNSSWSSRGSNSQGQFKANTKIHYENPLNQRVSMFRYQEFRYTKEQIPDYFRCKFEHFSNASNTCNKAFGHVEKLFIQRYLFIHPRFVSIVQTR